MKKDELGEPGYARLELNEEADSSSKSGGSGNT